MKYEKKYIKSRSELNNYYSIIFNVLIDYKTSLKVTSEELYLYVNNNVQDLLSECGLSDVVGAERVLLDVVSHILNADSDGLTKFESFIRRNM